MDWQAVSLGSIAIAILIVGYAIKDSFFYRNRALNSIAESLATIAEAINKRR